jgi:hypothetical protein
LFLLFASYMLLCRGMIIGFTYEVLSSISIARDSWNSHGGSSRPSGNFPHLLSPKSLTGK